MIQVFYLYSDLALFLLRLILGGILIYHGLPKLKNFKETAVGFAQMGFKPGKFWTLIVVLVEFLGGIFIVFGFLTQLVGLLVFLQFLVIIIKLKLLKKASFKETEFDLLILASSLILLTVGSGIISLDNIFLLNF